MSDQTNIAFYDELLRDDGTTPHLDTVLFVLAPEKALGIRYVSPNVVRLLGYDAEALLADPELWMGNVHPEDRELVESGRARLLRHGSASYQYRFLHKEGYYVHVQDDLRRVTSPVDATPIILGCAVGVRFGAARGHLAAFNRIIANAVSSAIYIADTMGYLEWTNENFERFFGFGLDESRQQRLHMLRFDDNSDDATIEQWKNLLLGRPWVGNARKITRAGREVAVSEAIFPILNENGIPFRFVGILDPVRERDERRDCGEEAERQYDSLTGMPNVFGFEKIGAAHLRTLAERKSDCLCAMISIDNFEDIEYLIDERRAAELLYYAAGRIRNAAAKGGLVAHLGGVKFAILQRDDGDLRSLVRALREGFAEPFVIAGDSFRLQIRTGIARARASDLNLQDLMARARVALKKARREAAGGYAEYEAVDLDACRRQFQLVQSLGQAARRNELVLYYQPIVRTSDLAIAGAETLVRWRHPELGLVGPVEFIPLAERTGDIIAIGNWIFRSACAQKAAWRDAGLDTGPVAVNVSVAQLRRREFATWILEAAKRYQIAPEEIEIEITESILLESATVAMETLRRIHRKGFRLVLDDFGTGYSTLAYLNLLPISKVKVDRLFVQRARRDRRSETILRCLVSLARDLDCTILGEGVEDRETLDYLNQLGFHEVQGFFTGHPMPPERFAEALAIPAVAG